MNDKGILINSIRCLLRFEIEASDLWKKYLMKIVIVESTHFTNWSSWKEKTIMLFMIYN